MIALDIGVREIVSCLRGSARYAELGGAPVTVYMVDRSLPGITLEQLLAAQRAAIDMSRQLTEEGKPVRYIRSTFVPSESRCMCLFESADEETTREVNVRAKIPFSRIVEAVDLTPKPSSEH